MMNTSYGYLFNYHYAGLLLRIILKWNLMYGWTQNINVWHENQLMSLFYSYVAGSLHVSGPQVHLQESSYSCSHNHWFSICTALDASRVDRYWTNGCVKSCTNSPEDGPVGPKHVETQQYTNRIVTSVGSHSIRWKDARYKKFKKKHQL